MRGEDARFGVLRRPGPGKLPRLGAFGCLVAGRGRELQDGDALSGCGILKHEIAAFVADVLRVSGEIEEGVAASAGNAAGAGSATALALTLTLPLTLPLSLTLSLPLTLTLTRLLTLTLSLALTLTRLLALTLSGGVGKFGCARRIFLQPFLERFGAVRIIVRGRESGVAGAFPLLTLPLTLPLSLTLTRLLTLPLTLTLSLTLSRLLALSLLLALTLTLTLSRLLALTLTLTLSRLLPLTLSLLLSLPLARQLLHLVVSDLGEFFDAFAQPLCVPRQRVGKRLKLVRRHGGGEVVTALLQKLRQ